MLIVEENHSYNGTGGIIGNTAHAPYINSLAQKYLSSTSWYSPDHGSPLDYSALLAGKYRRLDHQAVVRYDARR